MTASNTLSDFATNAQPHSPSARPPELAAVAYLNMLPFFFEKSQFKLFASPQALNAQREKFDAYCSSLIAGLEAGKTPIILTHGVFARGAVMSVFVEPLLHKESHSNFWKQLQELWIHRHPDPVAALRQGDCHGTILLRSAGESAQSVWMFGVLCAMAGFEVKVLAENEKFTSPDPEKPLPEARLYIGDAALFRLKSAPSNLRLDIGELWNNHTGQTAWFAGWFEGRNASAGVRSALEKTLNLQIDAWKESSEFARWCRCFAFLESQKQSPTSAPALQSEDIQDLRELLSDYFHCVEHKIAPEEGQELLNFYQDVKNALTAWQQGRSQGICRDLFPSSSKQPVQSGHLTST